MFKPGYTIKDQHAIYFLTFTVVQWVDVFTRPLYRDILLESFRYCQSHKKLKIHAWCIMSNHVHIICSSAEPNKLSDTVRDLKQYSSKRITEAIEQNDKESRKGWMMWIFKSAGKENKRNKDIQFWQQNNHPIECSTADIIKTRLEYTHNNPVKNKLVYKAEEYTFSSAMDYYQGEQMGLLEISFL
jgi:putative transposase